MGFSDADFQGEPALVLASWMSAEWAYEQGSLPLEALQAAQSRVGHSLGLPAVTALVSWVNERGLSIPDLKALAGDGQRLGELVQYLEEKARGPWYATGPSGDVYDGNGARPMLERAEVVPRRVREGAWLDTARLRRPLVLLVMAEYGVDDPVWDRSPHSWGTVRLADLGVSDALIRTLREWKLTYERQALSEWVGPDSLQVWIEQGQELADRLQGELSGIDVRYYHADNDRPPA